jgi:thiamine biosynthesis protein ThiI
MSVETILVAYGELALKSSYVRGKLEETLARQIGFVLRKSGLEERRVLRRFGRLYVEGVPAEAAEIIANIFGVVSVMPALKTSSDLESVIKLTVELASERIGERQSFALRTRTVGRHTYTSRELAVEAGSAILKALSGKGAYVNLDNPDVAIYIEVRDKDALVYTRIIDGVGGLPYGSQGRLVSLFSGGIDSPVATWLMMKRGAAVTSLFIDQRPYVGDSYAERAERAFQAIKRFVPEEDYGLYIAPFGDVSKRILDAPHPKLRCVLCKRAMYRVANALAVKRRANGIVTGESLGQVASQTLANLSVINDAVKLPVFRPLIGMDKVEIEAIARRVGTYDITARNVDGCSIVPEKPATKSQRELILELEEELGLVEMCDEAAKNITRKI